MVLRDQKKTIQFRKTLRKLYVKSERLYANICRYLTFDKTRVAFVEEIVKKWTFLQTAELFLREGELFGNVVWICTLGERNGIFSSFDV